MKMILNVCVLIVVEQAHLNGEKDLKDPKRKIQKVAKRLVLIFPPIVYVMHVVYAGQRITKCKNKRTVGSLLSYFFIFK